MYNKFDINGRRVEYTKLCLHHIYINFVDRFAVLTWDYGIFHV